MQATIISPPNFIVLLIVDPDELTRRLESDTKKEHLVLGLFHVSLPTPPIHKSGSAVSGPSLQFFPAVQKSYPTPWAVDKLQPFYTLPIALATSDSIV